MGRFVVVHGDSIAPAQILGFRRAHAGVAHDQNEIRTLDPYLGKDPVDAHPAEGDAPRRGEMVEGAHTLIAMGLPIADAKLLAASGAAQKTRQQGFAGADGASADEPLAIGVVRDQLLVSLKLGPRNVPLVVVADQNLQLRQSRCMLLTTRLRPFSSVTRAVRQPNA
jgi:hypothetical protein